MASFKKFFNLRNPEPVFIEEVEWVDILLLNGLVELREVLVDQLFLSVMGFSKNVGRGGVELPSSVTLFLSLGCPH